VQILNTYLLCSFEYSRYACHYRIKEWDRFTSLKAHWNSMVEDMEEINGSDHMRDRWSGSKRRMEGSNPEATWWFPLGATWCLIYGNGICMEGIIRTVSRFPLGPLVIFEIHVVLKMWMKSSFRWGLSRLGCVQKQKVFNSPNSAIVLSNRTDMPKGV